MTDSHDRRHVSRPDLESDRAERLRMDLVSLYSQHELAASLPDKLGFNPMLRADSPMLPFLLELLSAAAAEDAGALEGAAADWKGDTSPTPPLPMIFDRVLFVLGVRRSGNHAIINWLIDCFPKESVLSINSADPAFFRIVDERVSIDRNRYGAIHVSDQHRVLIVSYENLDPALVPVAHNAQIANRAHTIFVLRDLANTAASIVRGAKDYPSFSYRFRVLDFPAVWCRYARLLLAGESSVTPVLFNRWFADPSYRANILAKLDIARVDGRVDAVSSYGGGSSFDGLARDGNASSMSVLSRWREMEDDQLFQFLILAEQEAIELSERLFSMGLPTREEWLERWRK